MKLLTLFLHFCIIGMVAGCLPLIPCTKDQPRDGQIRFVRVAVVTENGMTQNTLKAIKGGFAKYREKGEVDIGAVTTLKIDLIGCKTCSEIYRRVFQRCIPLGPKYADIFIVRTNRLFIEDAFFFLGVGPHKAGSVEILYRRFMLLRVDSASLVSHELMHVFETKGKNRRFDGWYMMARKEGE